MLLNMQGQKYEYNGSTFEIGMGIYAVASDYEGLYGTITELRDDEHKDTENPGADIYCRFFPPVNNEVKATVEKRFATYYCEPVKFEDLATDLVIMAPEMLRPVKQCRVFQLTPKGHDFMFMSLEYVKSKGLDVPPGDLYRIVYDGFLQTDNLEEIYYLLNCNHPSGFKGWSLSVSDIVDLYAGDDHTYYYCDSFGFTEVPFVPSEKEENKNESN